MASVRQRSMKLMIVTGRQRRLIRCDQRFPPKGLKANFRTLDLPTRFYMPKGTKGHKNVMEIQRQNRAQEHLRNRIEF